MNQRINWEKKEHINKVTNKWMNDCRPNEWMTELNDEIKTYTYISASQYASVQNGAWHNSTQSHGHLKAESWCQVSLVSAALALTRSPAWLTRGGSASKVGQWRYPSHIPPAQQDQKRQETGIPGNAAISCLAEGLRLSTFHHFD